MIAVDRAARGPVVSQGPSTPYKVLTSVWALVVIIAPGVLFQRPAWIPLGAGLLAGAALVLLVLLFRWRTTTHRFDRVAGLVAITRTGPLLPSRTHEVALDQVTAVVDRRSGVERAIELVLADRSALVVASARATGSPALDRVAREIGDLLDKPVELQRGVVIADRFEIDRLVQKGGMGVVYRALDRASGNPVALKLMLEGKNDSQRFERFGREIRILAGLNHPRIARHVSHGETTDGRAYLAMEWLDGDDLGHVLARGPLSLADGMRVLVGACEALSTVHGQGIIHRDLKPSNLFLRGGAPADLVLLDFGVARRLEGHTGLTSTAALVGTPHYMAPEQASSSPQIPPAADIFSLGCIFYECLTGKHPFDAPYLPGVLARILFDSPDPVHSLRPSVPQAWSDLLARMLAKDPAARPPDGAALLRELASLPPVGAETAPETRSSGEAVAAGRDSGDQVLVCVVLGTLPTEAHGDGYADRFESVRTAMGRFGCPIERLADGSIVATVFPRQSATDQVRIAARCALYLHELLPEARIAVATGRAPLHRSPRIGDAVDRAVRMLERRGEARAAHSWDGIRLDGVSAGLLDARFVTASRDGNPALLGENPDLDESRPLLGKPTPCVGREVELVQLEGLMSSAVDEAVPKAAVVVGSAGIGKSRLRHELLRRLRDGYPRSELLVGYGDPVNAGSPYVLVGDALRRHAGIRVRDEPSHARALVVDNLCRHVDPAQRQRVAEFLGELCGVPFDAEQSPPLRAARGDRRLMSEQITMAFLDWLAAECAVHPVVLALEDAQWGDALTMKLLEDALRDLTKGPLYVIVVGRPEVEEVFPKLLAGRRALSLSLRALSSKASERLVKGVLGDAIDQDSVARVVGLAAGNALFLEELIRAAVDGKAGDVPETVLAILQARLSRLAPEARLVLRAASVLGETFWRSGVQRTCATWGGLDDMDRWLEHLVEDELVERQRASRFPADVEYVFRHALVCDAAHGLLTEADRRSGHITSGQWLEAMGESDGIVLARHAEEGGDVERAISFYSRAADESLGRNDFGEALTRATKGIGFGAKGEALGILLSVKASALNAQARWTESADVGLSALELLPKGGVWWCATVEKLLQVLPNVDRFERHAELSAEMLRTSPAPEARAAYSRALHGQLLGYALSGARQKGMDCLDVIDKLGADVAELDIITRGFASLWRGSFLFIVDTDMCRALSLIEQAIRDLTDGEVKYRLSFCYVVQAFIHWGLGDHVASEHAARTAVAIAQQLRDDYDSSVGNWYLGFVLSEGSDPARLEEAEACAEGVRKVAIPMHQDGLPQVLTARVALARGDWRRAEADSRRARARLTDVPAWRFIAAAHLMQALVRQSRGQEAAEAAREDFALLRKIGGPLCTEVLLDVAVAEALFEGGDRAGAEGALREALAQIELRAANIPEGALKQAYLRRAENRRAFELARAWR